MNQKKRILIPVVGKGSIIHVVRTGMLEKLKLFCDPIIALQWPQDDLVEELKANSIEVHIMPTYVETKEYNRLRQRLNHWYYNNILKTPSISIEKEYVLAKKSLRQRVRRRLVDLREDLKILFYRGYAKRLIAREKMLFSLQPSYDIFKNWLAAIGVDGMYTVTPFLNEVELIARLCRDQRKHALAFIHSFDNLTKRGWPGIIFDHYCVWNKYNREQLKRIHPSLSDKSITITGAPQFDLHTRKQIIWSEEHWRKKLKIPLKKKIILYSGGGSASLIGTEPQYLKDLHEGVKSGFIKNTVILFRCHPLDNVERWMEFAGCSEHIVYDFVPTSMSKKDHQNFTLDDVSNLISTLRYSDVHVNLASTMTVDGCVFGKPQIGPYYDAVNPLREPLLRKFYEQEHYLPIMKTTVVHLAHSKEELLKLTSTALNQPDIFNSKTGECLKEIITYDDGMATDRVVDKVKTLLDEHITRLP